MFSTRPASDGDRKLGRFNIDTCLKRQKYVVHGYEARTLKHIPKLLYVICERIVRLCDQANNSYNANVSNFIRNFIVYKMNHNSQPRLISTSQSLESTPSDSMVVTRRSSQTLLLGDSPTPSGDSRPSSETNSLVQSCSSALSGVDDKRLDEILADGIKEQTLEENKVM